MTDHNVDLRVGLTEPGGQLLGAVDGPVLPTSASEVDGEVRELALEVFVDALRDNGLSVGEKEVDGGLPAQKVDNGTVLARVGLIFGITARIGQGAAVEDVASSVA